MSLKSNLELMADYNQAMNSSFYAAASRLNTEDLARNQNAFFGSIIGTLNHILVADTVWLKRFSNHKAYFASLDYVRPLQMPTSLDLVLYSDFSELRDNREQMDEVIKQFTLELTEEVLLQPFTYKSMKVIESTKIFGEVLLHFFNHQTHHRGQVSTLLYQQGIDVGVTDLLVTIPNV